LLVNALRKHFARNKKNGVSFWKTTVLLPLKLVMPKKSAIIGFRLFDKPLLISYSRSGTNWIRYVIEYLTGKPTPGAARLIRKGNDYVIDRAHRGYAVINEYKKVILIIRDYRECLLRHMPEEWRNSSSVHDFLELRKAEQPPFWYIRNIEAFDQFKGEKACFYYEDMVRYPEKEIPRLVDFLQLPKDRLDDLLGNMERHQKKSILCYGSNKTSVTQGKTDKLNRHALTHTSLEERKEFDLYYKKRYPDIYRKYLERYEVKK
jgi:hypothetical protein